MARKADLLTADPLVGGDIPAGGQTRREDGLADWVIWQTLSGACHLHGADGGRFVSTAPEVVIIQPRAFQEYGSEGDQPWHVRWLVVNPPDSWATLLRWPDVLPGIAIVQPAANASQRIADHLDDAWRLAAAERMTLAMHACHAALLWLAEANTGATATSHVRDGYQDPRITQVCDIIRQNPAAMIDLASAAWRASLSVPQFARLFRRAHGTSFQCWLEALRLGRARMLLRRSTLSISDVAHACGYQDPFYFSARFRQHQGMSPQQFRVKTVRSL